VLERRSCLRLASTPVFADKASLQGHAMGVGPNGSTECPRYSGPRYIRRTAQEPGRRNLRFRPEPRECRSKRAEFKLARPGGTRVREYPAS